MDFKSYFSLIKPGIIFGNLITASAGFFLASKNHPNFVLFIFMIVGLAFIIAASCVFNNFLDQEIDRKMSRTKNRVLVRKVVEPMDAFGFGLTLGLIGLLILVGFTNPLTVSLAVAGLIFYVLLYTPLKKRTIHSTLVGSISGAMPPVVGYCAVTNRIDLGSVLLFLILVFWQVPHTYGITMFKLKDYDTASIPLLPVKKGVFVAKIHSLLYIIAFLVVSVLLSVFGYTGNLYLVVISILSALWLGITLYGFKAVNSVKWARLFFAFSLVVLIVDCVFISLH